jgi:ribosome biogenesis GTPase / thiamine phosphate phosphatase
LRGRLKQESGSIVIGDRVSVDEADDAWTVESVSPRETTLVRRARGGRAPKVLAANLQHVFVVVAMADPPTTTELIDRLLVLVEASGVHPLLVLNKIDLERGHAATAELRTLYEALGYRVLPVSARSGEGLEELRSELETGASAFIGPSGVGKSSLLNALDPDLELRVGPLSAKTGTGRHTTVSSRLIRLSTGGLVADTPGFGDVALWGVEPGDVASCFPEFEGAICRFRSCTHVHEPGCAVREGVAEGRVRESRYRSYVKLRSAAVEAAER